MQHLICVIDDFATMIVETDNHSKLEKLKKNMDKSNTQKIIEQKPTGLAVAVFYSRYSKWSENETFSYTEEDL